MTRTEITIKIEKLEDERYMLSMKDRWNSKDYDKDFDLKKEISELRKILETL